MLVLTVSFTEILNYLKKNLKKVPWIVKHLNCEKNVLSLTVPWEREDSPGIPFEAALNYNGHTFKVNARSGAFQSLACVHFTAGELFDFLKKNIREFPPFPETMGYEKNEHVFHLNIKPETEDIEILAKLIPVLQPEKGVRLRIAAI